MGSRDYLPRAGRYSDWQLYRRLLSYAAPYWLFFLLSFAGYALYSAGVVLLADLMQLLLDALGPEGGAQGAGATGILSTLAYTVYEVPPGGQLEFVRVAVPLALLLLTVLRASGFFAGAYFISLVARNLIHDLRCQLFDKMLRAPGLYFDRHSHGVLVSRVTFNVEQVTGAVTKALKTILRESLVVVALVGYMLYLNWRLCLLFLVVAPFITLVVTLVGRLFRRYSRRIQASMGEVTQVTGESVGAWREVRMFGGRQRQAQRFATASDYNRRQSLKLAFAEALGTPVIQGLLALALALLLWFALSPAVLADFSAGSLVAFLVAAVQLGKPLRQLSGVQSVLQRGLAAAEDIFAQLDQPDEADAGELEVDRVAGNITVRGLSFTYPGAQQPVLHDISVDIAAGETVALVGPSGAGKSTLTRLLARFYPAPAGSLLLDGVPLEDYRLDCLRRQIALVSQDAPLFRDTVWNNIAYGGLGDCTREQVRAAAESACALEFIDALPQGFDTVLGEGGGGLSGGQRQRIAIARAILKDAPLLILDEATSALDNASEHRLQQALASVMRGRTTLVIAHRLSTVEQADRILVLDQGRLVAAGSHAQLLAQGGLYAQLYQREFSA
ncbi:MAG: lipid A export permease/ATP-binding protein MsbA [Halioglobus sp.]|nr:lipid A export permease/ATP-binding protein MsbA [Halioglobus sp.]